jgi:hypothetical protein
MFFAVVGQTGSVILFVTSGLGVLLLGTYFLCLAAHYYRLTFQDTAVGIDRVEWPSDSFVDWFSGSLALLVQVLLWIMPAGFLARFLAPVWLPEQAPLRFAVLMGLAFWLLFPLGLLLSTASQQASGVAVRLLLALPTLVLFYLLSGVVCLITVALGYGALFADSLLGLLGAIVGLPVALLWHARLVGRLGWLVGREEVSLGKDPKQGEDELEQAVSGKVRPRSGKRKRMSRPEVLDPWAVPEEEPIEADLIEESPQATARSAPASYEPQRVEGYGLAAEEPPSRPALELPTTELPKPRRKRRPVKGEASGAASARVGQTEESGLEKQLSSEELQRERRLREREELPPPRSLFFHGVWEFPFYPSNLSALVWLSLYGAGAWGLARFMISVSPFSGGAK